MFKKEYEEFEKEGEDSVRRKYKQGLYSGRKMKAAESWLDELASKREEDRYFWQEARSWAAVGIALIALVVSILVAIYK